MMAELIRPQDGCKKGSASLYEEYEEVHKFERFELES
jgi:hypothetical protein